MGAQYLISLAVWWAKLEKNKVRHNVTQIASLLVVASVFTWLTVCILPSEGGLIHETKLPTQELGL